MPSQSTKQVKINRSALPPAEPSEGFGSFQQLKSRFDILIYVFALCSVRQEEHIYRVLTRCIAIFSLQCQGETSIFINARAVPLCVSSLLPRAHLYQISFNMQLPIYHIRAALSQTFKKIIAFILATRETLMPGQNYWKSIHIWHDNFSSELSGLMNTLPRQILNQYFDQKCRGVKCIDHLEKKISACKASVSI